MSPEKDTVFDISVEIESSCDLVDFDRPKMVGMVRQVTEQFGIKQAKVTVAVLTEQEIISINTRFLSRSVATDVISFDLSEDNGPVKIFDIAVNAQMALSQADSRGHSVESELALYVVHGLLHNLGFDDLAADDASEMHKAEDKFLNQFGYGTVYNKPQRG